MSESDERNRRYIQRALIVLFFLYWLFAYFINRMDFSVNPPAHIAPFVQPEEQTPPFMLFIMEMVASRVVLYLIPFGLAWYLAQYAVVGLVRDLFDLPARPIAKEFLSRYMSPHAPPGAPVKIRRTDFKKDRLQQPLLRYGGPGRISVDQGDVVVTERNGRFMAVYGPGIHILRQYEYVRAVLDTRTQERAKFGVRLFTKDGIDIKTDVVVTFNIGRGGVEPTQENPFPFDKAAVRKTAYAEVLVEDGHVLNWEALPMRVTVEILRKMVAKQSLDRLLYPRGNAELKPHEKIKDELETRTRAELKKLGIDLVHIRLSRLEVPEEVTRQRIEFWRAFGRRQQQEQAGRGEMEAQRQLEAARAQATAEAIRELVERIQEEQYQLELGSAREIGPLRLVQLMERIAQQTSPETAEHNLEQRLENVRQQLALSSGSGSAEDQ